MEIIQTFLELLCQDKSYYNLGFFISNELVEFLEDKDIDLFFIKELLLSRENFRTLIHNPLWLTL